jgi:hypothetical protein
MENTCPNAAIRYQDSVLLIRIHGIVCFLSPLSPPVSEPLTYRGVLSTLLQAILNTFLPFVECIITD